MKKKFSILLLILLGCLVMAFQCDDDKQTLFGNNVQANLTAPADFSVGDTLWIRGQVSANVYDSELRDSVFDPSYEFSSQLSLSELVQVSPDRTNEIQISDALDRFRIINREGSSSAGRCSASELRILTELDQENNQYRYEIGLVPREAGEYILHFYSGTGIRNNDRNLDVLNAFTTGASNPSLTCRNCCSGFSLDVQATQSDFLFSVD